MAPDDRSVGCVLARTVKSRGLHVGASTHPTCFPTKLRGGAVVCRLLCIHRDQHGTISIISVFVLMLLTMLLGMVMNVGRQVDGKIRMQNTADAAAYSGTVVLARGMNTLAFTNHLLSDVFALTAFMREARDQRSQRHVPEILAAWNGEATKFAGSGFAKFERLGSAIGRKVPMEQAMVDTYVAWSSAASALILPVMEEILAEELIPQYQRAVVEAFPDVAQTAVAEIARRNSSPDLGRGEMTGTLWRPSVQPVGGYNELADPSLPVVDPVLGTMPDQAAYFARALDQRRRLAFVYLDRWNNQSLVFFDYEGPMSQFGNIWRSYTCGYLKQLLAEYPDSNLPFQIRTRSCNCAPHDGDSRATIEGDVGTNVHTDSHAHPGESLNFIAVVYWRKLPEMMPGLYENPTDNDQVAYAAARVFVPRPRLVWQRHGGACSRSFSIGGVPGDYPGIVFSEEADPTDDEVTWSVVRQYRGHERHFRREWKASAWNLLNQRWTCQLVPATHGGLAEILQTPPPQSYPDGEEVNPPGLGGLGSEDIQLISPH